MANGSVALTRANEAYEHEKTRAERAEDRADNIRTKLKEAADEGVQSAVLVGTAFGGGYAAGRWKGKSEVFGFPAAAVVSTAALGGIMFKVGGKSGRRYLLSVAQGGAAATATMMGVELGEEAAEDAVSGVGARRRRRRDRDRELPENDSPPVNLPPGLRNLYNRSRREAHR